jgi:hypothetical protein
MCKIRNDIESRFLETIQELAKGQECSGMYVKYEMIYREPLFRNNLEFAKG